MKDDKEWEIIVGIVSIIVVVASYSILRLIWVEPNLAVMALKIGVFGGLGFIIAVTILRYIGITVLTLFGYY